MTIERRSLRKAADRVLSIEMEPDIDAIVLNTSEDGLGFRALSPVTKSGTIRFWFADQGQRVEVSGELAWFDATKKNGGLNLASVPQVIRERIRHWMELSAPGSVGAGFAPATSQTKEFPLPSPDPFSAAYTPPPAAYPPPAVAYVPPAGLPLPQPALPGYVIFEDESQYLEDSHTRFFPGFMTGAIVSVILGAILFFVYGNQAGGLWNRVRAAIDPSSVPQAAVPAPPAVPIPPPPVSSAWPPSGSSTEAPVASAPAHTVVDESRTDSAAAPAAPPAAIDDRAAAASDTDASNVADPGDAELARAQRYLNSRRGLGDSAAAVPLLWAAVEKGNITAVTTLAGLYARGDGVTKSCNQARVLLRAAAAKGSSEASQQLAQMIRSGSCG